MWSELFWLSVTAGILATYAHMVIALWAPRVGLPRLDFAKGMALLSFDESFDGEPPYWLGLLALHLNGVIFALLYATVVGPLLPGPQFVRGLIYGGVILLLASQLFFVPVVLKQGIFGLKENPRAWMTAVLVHLVYGAVLGWLCPIVNVG